MDSRTALAKLCQLLNQTTSPESPQEILSELSLEDWTPILEQAAREELTLLLYDRVQTLDQGNLIPQAVQEQLHTAFLRATAMNIRNLFHAGMILEALREKQIEVIVLKGLYLLESVYSNIGLRTFVDLDLMVHKSDLAAASVVMQGLGYQLSAYFDFEDANRDIKHLPTIIKAGAPLVEIHWSILEEDEPFAIDMEEIWRHAQSARVAGVDVKALDLEDLILHLSIHFTYQHRLKAGLRSLFDLAVIHQKYQTQIDWPKLIETAKEWKAERVIWLTFRLLERVTGVTVPAAVYQDLLAQAPDPAVLEEALQQLMRPKEDTGALTPDLAALPDARGPWAKISLILSRIFIPRRIMSRLYKVEPRSVRIYGYYWVRFKELFRNYSNTMVGIWKRDDKVLAELNQERVNTRLITWMNERQGA